MYYVCTCLRFAIRVLGDAEEQEALLGTRSPHTELLCPECRRVLKAAPFIEPDLLVRVQGILRELSPLEAHFVFEDLGFPEERSCGEDTVRSVLVSHKIKEASIREIRGTGRTVVDSLTLEDGTTVFLSGSGWGALVYRVRKPMPYTAKEAK